MRDKGTGTDRREVSGPNFESNYLKRAKTSPTESSEHWSFQAEDSWDIKKVKGLLSTKLSCPGT